MLDFKPTRYEKKDELGTEYKCLWRHLIKLLSPVQRFAVVTPWVTYNETLRLLGIHGIYFSGVQNWWDFKVDGGKVNRVIVKIRKLKFIISHLNEEKNYFSTDDIKLVPAIDKADEERIKRSLTTLRRKTRMNTTMGIPFRYLGSVLNLNESQVLGFYTHFEDRKTLRKYRFKNGLKFYVRIYDAIKFLNDMRRMKMFSMNKKLCKSFR